MPCRWTVMCTTFRLSRVTYPLMALLGLALLAPPASAQQDAADSVAQAPPSNRVFYADVWTPRTRTGEIHLHGGLFYPLEASATGATLGTRIGVDLGSHVLLGISGDWTFKSKSLRDSTSYDLPGFEPEIVLAKVDAHLIPAMVFLQVKLTNKFPLVPYAGIGAGYEWLILSAYDYRTDEKASVTYANWAWQGYAGMGLRLSQGVRVDGELFYNAAMPEREVEDPRVVVGREAVDAHGVGARVGLNFVY